MSFVERFAPHLPFLRRYARALTGTQKSGDAYVRASLTALAENPDHVSDGLPDRVALYQFCHAIWSNTGATLEGNESKDAHDLRLQTLAPMERQAFLLTSVEGFTQSEAAQILGITPANVDQLIIDALAEIENGLKTTVLIIEDEPIIAADLELIVQELGHSVTGNATTRDQAVSMAKADRPGLVLCDVHLADGSSGIDAIEEILKIFDVPVIFITAFPERLLTGERTEPTYLITKPFQSIAIKAAIAQALFFHEKEPA